MRKWLKDKIAVLLIPLTRSLLGSSAPDAVKNWVYQQMFLRQCEYAIDFEVDTPLGIRWRGNTRDKIDLSIYYFGIWEPELTFFLKKHLRPGDVFLDVGSHVGWYSMIASQLVGPTGKVVCIEASPRNFARLEDHLRINNCTNVRLVHAAAWFERAQLDLFQGQDANSGRTSVKESFSADLKGRKISKPIDAYPLPELLTEDEISRATFIKIDTEGAEREVVRGMTHMLDKLNSNAMIAIEVTPSELAAEGHGIEDFLAPFRNSGFSCCQIENDYDLSRYHRWILDHTVAPLRPLPEHMEEQLDVLISRQPLV